MSRQDRRAGGDRTPLVTVPEGMGDEPRMQLSQATIDYVGQTPSGANPYRCRDCGGWTVTVHLHPGVTPMFLPCGAGTGCGGEAVSSMYPPAEQLPILAELPVLEWYRPSADEFRELGPDKRAHVERGGCLLRRRGDDVSSSVRGETDDEKRARVQALFGGSS